MVETELKRELGVFDVAINVINISIASGIFLLPALIAGILGDSSILAFILCGLMFLLVALCYAEMSSRVTNTGGAYAYIVGAFGPFWGFISSMLLWFGTGVIVTAALMNGIADTLSTSFPIFENIYFRGLLFLGMILLLAIANIVGIKQGMKIVKTITLTKVLPLVLLVVIGLLNFQFDKFNINWIPSMEKLGAASLILFFAFTGGETALTVSGEMKNPNRTAPIGLLIAVISIVLFYGLIQIVSQNVLGTNLIDQKAPLAAVASTLLGSWGFRLIIACTVISIFGSLHSLVMGYTRVMYASAQDDLLPAWFSRLHPKHATPYLSILIFCALAFIFALTGGFKQLLILATLSTLLIHGGVAFSLIKFRIKSYQKDELSFVLPGGLLIPILTLLILAWFIAQSKYNEIKALLIFCTTITIFYLIKKYYFTTKKTI